eukprot:6740911-Prymnesium_polylepis.1
MNLGCSSRARVNAARHGLASGGWLSEDGQSFHPHQTSTVARAGGGRERCHWRVRSAGSEDGRMKSVVGV